MKKLDVFTTTLVAFMIIALGTIIGMMFFKNPIRGASIGMGCAGVWVAIAVVWNMLHTSE